MIAAEFVVQALQMRFGTWEQNTATALAALTREGQIAEADARELKESYDFLRRIESALRRYENKSVSLIPNDELAQRQLAHRVGAHDTDDFAQRYRRARATIHEIYTRYMSA